VGDAQVLAREPLPLAVRGEELVDAVDVGARPRVAGGDAADELEVADVAGGDAVEAPLAVRRQHLQRPRPDAGDGAEPAPAGHRVGGEQVDAPGRDLGGRPAQRQRPRRGEVHRDQPRRGGARDHRGRRRVAQAGLGAAPAELRDHPPLDRDRPLELDQLLGDRGRERLPGERRPADPQPRHGADGLADDGVVAERLVERAQVVVDAGGEPEPPDPPHGVGLRVRSRAEDHPAGRGLDDRDVHRRAVLVQQPLQGGPAAAHEAVGGAAGQPERPGRADLDAELVLHGWFISGGATGCSVRCRVLRGSAPRRHRLLRH